MRIQRDVCCTCDVEAVIVRLTLDEARMLSAEIRKAPGPWPGPLSECLTARIEKAVR